MSYHRFYTPLDIFQSGDGLGKHRETCVDEITFDENGYMQITPTLEGVSAVNTKSEKEEFAIVKNPESVEGVVGETAEFTVEATGKGLTYEWQYCNANSTKWRTSVMEGSDTATVKVPVANWRDGQKYRCVVTNGDGGTADLRDSRCNHAETNQGSACKCRSSQRNNSRIYG